MLNIGFILPSSDYLHDPFRGDPHTHLYLLTVLESHFGNRINPLLIDLRGIKKEYAIYHIPECDVYLHSGFTLDYYEVVSITKELRKRYPKARHIAGGPHSNMFPEECLKIFDSIVTGEGEKSIIQAITDIMNLTPKTVYKQEGPIDINLYPHSSRKYLTKPVVARKGLMTLKKKEGFENLLSTTVMFSRGCPYHCYFCALPYMKKYGSLIRYRKPELIENEIEYLKRDYNIEGITLIDEIAIPLNPKEAVTHLGAFARAGIIWRGQCRVNGLTLELAKLARESGCIALGLGIESVSQRSLDMMNKKINISEVKQTINLLKKNDIEVRVFLIMGLPAEPEDIVKQTWEFIEETAPDLVFLSLLTVRPGTIIYNNPKKFGIKHVNTDWSKTMAMFGRYEDETPTLTFEYEEQAPWGKGFSKERIINNYLELQTKLRESKLSTLPVVDNNELYK